MARDPGLIASRRTRAAKNEPRRPSRLRLWLRRRRGLWKPAGVALLGLAALVFAGAAVLAFDPQGRLAALLDRADDLGADAGLQVRQVILEGSRHTPVELVREQLGVRQGDPILAFNPAEAKERLETIAWVREASVQRHLNGTIRVVLVEREPFAIWQHNGSFHVIDRAGATVTQEDIGAFGPLPLVVGEGANQAAATILDQLAANPAVRERVQALVRISDRRWNLLLRNKAEVLLPEGQEAAALRRLADLQARQSLLDRPVAIIDLRLPDKMVVRVANSPAPAAESPSPPVLPAPKTRSGRG
jgi:cell division protein FtsQ